ncbi:MAG: hypothetical protein AAF493_12850 [Pseudomonadota bacterium]
MSQQPDTFASGLGELIARTHSLLAALDEVEDAGGLLRVIAARDEALRDLQAVNTTGVGVSPEHLPQLQELLTLNTELTARVASRRAALKKAVDTQRLSRRAWEAYDDTANA